jgi:hypothetical protein
MYIHIFQYWYLAVQHATVCMLLRYSNVSSVLVDKRTTLMFCFAVAVVLSDSYGFVVFMYSYFLSVQKRAIDNFMFDSSNF